MCCAGAPAGSVIHFILTTCNALSEFVQSGAGVKLGQIGSRCTQAAVSMRLQVPPGLCGGFTGVVQLAAVLFCSPSRAWGGVCRVASRLPSQQAEASQGAAGARRGEPGLTRPWGMGFLLSPQHFLPGRASLLKLRQTESRQPVTPLSLERLASGIWI